MAVREDSLHAQSVEAGAAGPHISQEILKRGSEAWEQPPVFETPEIGLTDSRSRRPSYSVLLADCQFRLASEADVGAIVNMMAQRRQEHGGQEQAKTDNHATRSALRRLIGRPSLGQLWLICDGFDVVGYFILTFGSSVRLPGPDAYVEELFVVPAHRQRGPGRRALAFAQAIASVLGSGMPRPVSRPEKEPPVPGSWFGRLRRYLKVGVHRSPAGNLPPELVTA